MADPQRARARPARTPAPTSRAWTGLVVAAGLLASACPPASAPCASDQDCSGSALCVSGVCRTPCNTQLDCTGREQCQDGVCVPAAAGVDAAHPDAAAVDLASVDTLAADGTAADRTAADAAPVDAGTAEDAAASADHPAPDAALLEDALAQDHATAADSAGLPDATATDRATSSDGPADAAWGDAAVVDAASSDTAGSELPPVDATDGDAGATDAGGADAGGSAAGCGTVELMADDFEDGEADWRWYPWASSGTRVSETQGHLEITLGAGLTADAYAGYNSSQHTSLLDRSLVVELVQGVSVAGSAQTSLVFRRDRDNQFTITQTGNTLRASHTVGGASDSSAVTYQAAIHRWLRIRETDAKVYYETSPDGGSWNVLHSAPTPAFASAGRVLIEAGTYQPELAPGRAIFDNLGLAESGVDWCPLASLQDDFASPRIGLMWDPASEAGCAVQVEAETLVFEASARTLCNLPSASVYRLQQSGLEVEVVRAPLEDVSADVGLALWSPVDNVDFELSAFANNQVAVWDSVGASYLEAQVIAPRVLGIRHDSSGVHWEVVDGDGARHHVYSLNQDVSAGPFFAILWLDCDECSAPQTTPVRAVLDRVNLP